MLFAFTYKPLGKVQKEFLEASSQDLAEAVATEYCQRKNVQLIPQSVKPAVAASEEILSKEQVAAVKARAADRAKAAEKEAAALAKNKAA